jgi:hypothetical protein
MMKRVPGTYHRVTDLTSASAVTEDVIQVIVFIAVCRLLTQLIFSGIFVGRSL